MPTPCSAGAPSAPASRAPLNSILAVGRPTPDLMTLHDSPRRPNQPDQHSIPWFAALATQDTGACLRMRRAAGRGLDPAKLGSGAKRSS